MHNMVINDMVLKTRFRVNKPSKCKKYSDTFSLKFSDMIHSYEKFQIILLASSAEKSPLKHNFALCVQYVYSWHGDKNTCWVNSPLNPSTSRKILTYFGTWNPSKSQKILTHFGTIYVCNNYFKLPQIIYYICMTFNFQISH